MRKVTVIIPCYNEAAGIAGVIKSFPRQKLAKAGYDLDILVVDNNSTDGTAEVAESSGARVVQEFGQGKGYAIRKGFVSLREDTDYVVMIDGDHTYKSHELIRMLEPLESGFSNVVIGSRTQGRMKAGSMRFLNRLGNFGFSMLVRHTYRVQVTDVLTGYFAWRREVIDELAPYLTSSGFAIEMEMITKMAKMGYEIYSVPITYEPRLGESSLRPFHDGFRILNMYLRSLTWRPDKHKVEQEVGSARRRSREVAPQHRIVRDDA